MVLSDRDKEWIEKAVEKELTTLQVKKKLRTANYSDDKVEEFVKYFEEIQPEEKDLPDIEDEKDFEKQVRDYFKDQDKLSYFEKREVKKWLKNLEKAITTLKFAIAGLKKEYEYILKRQDEKGILIERELQDLKLEIIDRIIDTKGIIYIEDPKSGKEATKENLKESSIDELIELMEDNVNVLTETVEGKLPKED